MCSCMLSSDSDSLWRKRKRINSEEIVSDVLPKHGRHHISTPPLHHHRSPPQFYITLAKESPARQSASEDSDDSLYDSFHGRETGT